MKRWSIYLLLACVLCALTACKGDGTDALSSLFHRHEWGEREEYEPEKNALLLCEEKTYYRACTRCHEVRFESGTAADHEIVRYYKTPSCTGAGADVAYCSRCIYRTEASVPASGHAPAEAFSHDEFYHWYICATCHKQVDQATHSFGRDGLCSVCKIPTLTNGIVYELSADGTYATVTGYIGEDKRIFIVPYYEGVPVRAIGEGAFLGRAIRDVIVPDTVLEIGRGAFDLCVSLESVTLGMGIKTLGERAFASCTKLEKISLPDSLLTIGERAFAGCNALLEIELPKWLQEIGRFAFEGCRKIRQVQIPDSVFSLGERAFQNCALLDKIEIGAGVRELKERTFYGCSSLVSVSLPATLLSIGENAFLYCSQLTIVHIRGGDADDFAKIQVEIGNDKLLGARFYYQSFGLRLDGKTGGEDVG